MYMRNVLWKEGSLFLLGGEDEGRKRRQHTALHVLVVAPLAPMSRQMKGHCWVSLVHQLSIRLLSGRLHRIHKTISA